MLSQYLVGMRYVSIPKLHDLSKMRGLLIMASNRTIRRALISVSDKTGLIELCKELEKYGVEMVSTGGTAQYLRDNNIKTLDVSEIAGFPEMMDGRVKTLHPKIHAAILAREEDQDILTEREIAPIDFVIVNLYPFSKSIEKDDCTLESAIENIDIGGPTMLRAAAKNYKRVTAVLDYNDYPLIIGEMREFQGRITEMTRYRLATKVFKLTARYDSIIEGYLNDFYGVEKKDKFPEELNLQFRKNRDLRYGENPHQQGALYLEVNASKQGISSADQIQGKELSYNNIADSDAALECVNSFKESHACVIVKHANPCGVACAEDQLGSYENAFGCDPTSAFGGVIAFNQPLEEETAKKILENQFVEVVIAPEITTEVRELFSKKPSIRLLSYKKLIGNQKGYLDYKRINGGLLVQEIDSFILEPEMLSCVTKIKPTKSQLVDLQFAWTVVKYVKSNAIVFAKDQRSIGIGAGQMSRIDSTKIAARKAEEANLEIKGCVMASDAFFPFRDTLDIAAKLGIQAIIQPGGSIKDVEVIAAADESKIAMVFTGLRHFRH